MSLPSVLFPALSLLLAAVLVELGARAWIRRRGRYYVWSPRARMDQWLDPDALPLLPPRARFEVNRDGERGDPPPDEASGCYRVLVLGASGTECRFIDQQSTWPAFVQTFLNRPENLELLGAPRAHVGNLGRSLATCDHLDRILEKVLPRYERLDAVIVMTGGADLVRWLSAGAPGEFAEEGVDLDELFDLHPEVPFGWRPRSLALVRVATSLRRLLRRSADLHVGAGRGIGRARRLRAKAAVILDAMPDPGAMLERLERSFRRLIRRAQRSARTVVVVRPCWVREELGEHGWMFAAGDLRTEDVRSWYSPRVATRLLELVDRRISSLAREMQVPEIDPKLLLDPGLAHFYDEAHLSPKGCEIVGGSVAQAILRERKGLFGSRFRAIDEDRHADVA